MASVREKLREFLEDPLGNQLLSISELQLP